MNAMSQGRPVVVGIVVVGIDGSEPARRAAVWAAEQAARRKVLLRLVDAVNLTVFAAPGAGYVPPGYFTAIERAGNDELESAGELVRRRYPELQIQLDLRTEHPSRYWWTSPAGPVCWCSVRTGRTPRGRSWPVRSPSRSRRTRPVRSR